MKPGKGGPAQITIEAVVIRANGDTEDLGVVSYWNKNPVKRLMWRLNAWRQRLS